MSFSYDFDLKNPLNFIRFKLNDNDSENPLFQDEEIKYFVDKLETPVSEVSLLKICSMLLRQEIRSLALSNKKEVAGRDTVERADMESLKYALQMIDEEIRGGSVVLTGPMYAGVNYREDQSNRENTDLEETSFYPGRLPRDRRSSRIESVFDGY